MTVALITGSGTYGLDTFESPELISVPTRWGDASVTRGRLAGHDVLHVSRHLPGHVRLSNHVSHQANIAALRELGADRVLATTVCGAVDLGVPLGSMIVFDDLHFLANRLADGSICTLYDEPGEPGRGHWILERPFAEPLREAWLAAAAQTGQEARDGGCYGHVDGPRFNTAAEIRTLAQAGVTAVSQTGGPETVLAGEAGLAYSLIGYATDYANGVAPQPTPVETLAELIARSRPAFVALLAAVVPLAAAAAVEPTGTTFRF